MPEKMRRHKVEEREQFTDSQKNAIMQKSDYRCIWCGKKVFLGYEGTIDHFVPLQKGGTNDLVNLVLMCKDCNLTKGSKVVPTNVAADYLNPKDKKELEEYFDNYVQTYDYISRGNLMACDIYEVFFLPEEMATAHAKFEKRGKDFNVPLSGCRYQLKRAYPDDTEKLSEYYIKYLKKYKHLGSRQAAIENIKFWLRFGCIYYIEKDNEIRAMSAVTVNKNGYISFTEFCYYSTLISRSLIKSIVSALTDAIMKENNLAYVPVSVNILLADKLCSRIIDPTIMHVVDGRLACQAFFMYNRNIKDVIEDEKFKEAVERFSNFISRFYDIENDIQLYLYNNNLMEMSWMADEILGRRFFSDHYYVSAQEFLSSKKVENSI